jgi:hypothetical protein
MLILEEAQYNSNLGCDDCPSQTTRARLTKNFIPKTLWEKRAWRKEPILVLSPEASTSECLVLSDVFTFGLWLLSALL